MPFQQDFERDVNDGLREGEAGPVEHTCEKLKQEHPNSAAPESVYEAEDLEKKTKDDTFPPRFSTLFGAGAPPPLAPSPQVVECCHREKKKSGVRLPMPLFIVLVIILLFESTALFAYTIIGLYQNVPSGLLAMAGVAPSPTPINRCACDDKPAAINFAPNFVFRDGQALTNTFTAIESVTLPKVTETSLTVSSTTLSASTTTMTLSGSITTSITTMSASTITESARTTTESAETITLPASTTTQDGSTITLSASTTTISASETLDDADRAQAASNIVGMFGADDDFSFAPEATSVTTQTPGVVHSTVVVTSQEGESSTEAAAQPTVTSVEVVDGPAVTIGARV